ncbi:hypothetical protein KI387_044060 [Taxus chinensis]|uniref:Integrase catalytic domain-containing protein n=1 Tax=Taxus chinensis TaxID=29808 RepID=A0AA38FYV2_TAXCH|nr:hypothetical protein KI387_044060 [Taxus chinensis]
MTRCKDWFYTLRDSPNKNHVSLGDDSSYNVKGIGNISLPLGKHDYKITDVLYVPRLTKNFLSVSQLLDHNLKLDFDSNNGEKVCLIRDKSRGSKIVAIASNVGRMFQLDFVHKDDQALVAKDTQFVELWHRRYGHINFGYLQTLQKGNMVKGLPTLKHNTEKCHNCLAGKQHRVPFQKNTYRAKGKLDLVHIDICGPMQPIHSGCQYFMFCVDDYSRKMWIYCLRNKSQDFETFQKFKALVENEVGRKIKTLHLDRGGEFTSNEFKTYLEAHGIRQQMPPTHTPQKNGIVERRNRTIMEMVRCMIDDSGLTKTFWVEATRTAVYLLNRVPTVALEGVTPQEAWSNQKPSISHLRVFRCKASMHIPKKNRNKLDMKDKKLIFIGYSEEALGYRLWDPKAKKVYTSRDVEFFEKKQADAPLNDSTNMQNTPLVKKKFDVPTEDDSDELDDGEKLDPPQANGTSKKLPTWYTQLIRDANLDEAPSTLSNPRPKTHSQACEEDNYSLMSRVVETVEPSTV